MCGKREWSRHSDLNRGPAVYEAIGLGASLTVRGSVKPRSAGPTAFQTKQVVCRGASCTPTRTSRIGDMDERRGLTKEWSIELDPSFQGRVVDGDLQLVSLGPPIRTIWIAVWSPPVSQPVDRTLAGIAQDINPRPVQRFAEAGADDSERRLAGWYPEAVDGRTQWGLHAYTVRRGPMCKRHSLRTSKPTSRGR